MIIVIEVHCRVLLRISLDALLDLLLDMLRDRAAAVRHFSYDSCPDRKFRLLDLRVQLSKIGRQIQPLLYQQIFYGVLKGSLPLRDEGFEVVRRERLSN